MRILRGIAVFLVCLLAGMAPLSVTSVGADTQVFPIPSASTSKKWMLRLAMVFWIAACR